MRNLLNVIAALCLAAILAGLPQAVHSQDYPNRPITLIVPFPPGGSTTVMARNVADRLAVTLGQQVVVDNRGGAGGTIGTRAAAKSAPDGYTILLGYTGTLSIAPSLYNNAGYDPRKDFAPIGMIGTAPSVLLVHPAVPVKSVAELIAYAKASTAPLQYGSPGVGTANHLAAELFANAAGIKLTHVPYKGSGPVMNDLVGGHIPMSFVPIPAAIGNVQGGRLRALAVTSPKRSALLPDLPTVQEAGVKGFDVALRYGLAAPAGTPRPIIERLNKELNAALASDEVKKRLANEGAEALPGTPEAYASDIDKEEIMWRALVSKLGLKVD
ncbi:MAG: tripartite tricarboxylate transporter substrate binding protein [Pseudolabrys sp.]|nr:tripartite tricarboxylate transporter substrate binding protein [Pseudolabrys sp.]MSP32772.1 tripartite tricarboxylate transporter substrate binding protein [Pseudolabrys sp.]